MSAGALFSLAIYRRVSDCKAWERRRLQKRRGPTGAPWTTRHTSRLHPLLKNYFPLGCLLYSRAPPLPRLTNLPARWLQCQANGSNVCQRLQRVPSPQREGQQFQSFRRVSPSGTASPDARPEARRAPHGSVSSFERPALLQSSHRHQEKQRREGEARDNWVRALRERGRLGSEFGVLLDAFSVGQRL